MRRTLDFKSLHLAPKDLFWLGLPLLFVSYVYFTYQASEIRISGLDFLFLMVFLSVLKYGDWKVLPRQFIAIPIILITSVVLHSAFVYLNGSYLSLSMLIKDTLKLAYMPLFIAVFIVFFKNGHMRRPGIFLPVLACLLAITLNYLVVELHLDFLKALPSILLASIMLFYFVSFKESLAQSDFYPYVITIFIGILVTYLCAYNGLTGHYLPTYFMILTACIASYRTTNIKPFLCLLLAMGVLIIPHIMMFDFSLSEDRGLHNRLVMWLGALQYIEGHYILGAGLGQIPFEVVDSLAKGGWKMQSTIHNSVLTLVMQMGVFSLPWLMTGFLIIYYVYRQMKFRIVINFLALIGTIAMFHDIFGIRSLLILIALVLSDCLFSKQQGNVND